MNPTNPRLEDFQTYDMLVKVHENLKNNSEFFGGQESLNLKKALKGLSDFLKENSGPVSESKEWRGRKKLYLDGIPLEKWESILLPIRNLELRLIHNKVKGYIPVKEGAYTWCNYFPDIFS